jgi:hypothetical protein
LPAIERPREQQDRPDQQGQKRHVGHKRRRQHEEDRIDAHDRSAEPRRLPGHTGVTQQQIHGPEDGDRERPRRDPQGREREAEQQAERHAPEDLRYNGIARVLRDAQLAGLEQMLNGPAVNPVVDERRALEWAQHGRDGDPGERDEQAVHRGTGNRRRSGAMARGRRGLYLR